MHNDLILQKLVSIVLKWRLWVGLAVPFVIWTAVIILGCDPNIAHLLISIPGWLGFTAVAAVTARMKQLLDQYPTRLKKDGADDDDVVAQ